MKYKKLEAASQEIRTHAMNLMRARVASSASTETDEDEKLARKTQRVQSVASDDDELEYLKGIISDRHTAERENLSMEHNRLYIPRDDAVERR